LRAILITEVLDPLEFRFVVVVGEARVACLRLMMTTTVARAELQPGTTLDVFTVDGFRRIGIARLLWPWATLVTVAEQAGFRPLLSPSRTRAGQAYAEAVGGDIPPLGGERWITTEHHHCGCRHLESGSAGAVAANASKVRDYARRAPRDSRHIEADRYQFGRGSRAV
jgi:hypothetical protein